MARLTLKKWFERFRPDEKTTTICVNGYTQICEPIFSTDSIYPQFQNCYLVGEAVDKLAAYEDAEEQGLLLQLPFEVGTEVYVLAKTFDALNNETFYRIEKYKIDRYIYNSLKNFVIVGSRKFAGKDFIEEHFFKEEIGKIIFKKYADAAEALKNKLEDNQ